jgi:hypothetical protein
MARCGKTQADLVVPREAVAAIGNSYRWIGLDLSRYPSFASQLAPRPNITQHAFFLAMPGTVRLKLRCAFTPIRVYPEC